MNNRKKFFVFSDVHGEFDALQTSLTMAGYDGHNPDHVLVSLGDDFDRGPKSCDVYKFLKNCNAICVKGNHDDFLIEALEKGIDGEYVFFNILHNGLYNTIMSFAGIQETDMLNGNQLDEYIKRVKIICPDLLRWLKNKPLYFETKKYIFVHAGIDPSKTNWKDTDEHFMLWDIDHSCDMLYNIDGKKVIIGHHHAFRIRQQAKEQGKSESPAFNVKMYGCTDENKPVCIGNKIAIDPCSNLTKKVNVIVIEDELLEQEIP